MAGPWWIWQHRCCKKKFSFAILLNTDKEIQVCLLYWKLNWSSQYRSGVDFLPIKNKIAELKGKGTADAVDFSLIDFIVPAYYVLTTAEASSNLSRYDGVRYGHRTAKMKWAALLIL